MQEHASFQGTVPVGVALALLTSLRDLDTPDDPGALTESDRPLNLQRKLGLSSVILGQIRRYEKQKAEVSATEVASLFELISRRSDAAEIFVDAGRRIAEHDLDQRGIAAKIGLRLMPQGLRRQRAWQRVRRIARGISPEASVRVDRQPYALVVERGLPSHAVEGGVGCSVLLGTIRSVFQEYRAGDIDVAHTSCEGHSGPQCAWQVGSVNGGGGNTSRTPDDDATNRGNRDDPPPSPEAEARVGSDVAQSESIASG